MGYPRPRSGQPLGRQLLALFVVFGLGPLFVSNLWGYLKTRSRLSEAAFRDVQNVASIEASEARRSVLQKRELVASAIAGNQHLFSLMRSMSTCSSAEACRTIQNALESHLYAKQAEGVGLELLAISMGRSVMATSATPPSAAREARPAPPAAEALTREPHRHADGHAHHDPPPTRPRRTRPSEPLEPAPESCVTAINSPTSVTLETHDAEPVLVVAQAVIDARGEHLGHICGRFDFDVHRFLMATTRERTSSAVSFLLDHEGEVICSSLHHQGRELGTEPGRSLRAPAGREPWAERAEEGRLLAAYTPVPDLPWGILVELPLASALSDLETLRWQAAVFGTLLGLILIAVAIWMSQRIALPLRRLAALAGRAAGGALGVPLRPEGPKEVVELANAFNEMSLALKDSHDQLEHRIADRTAELERGREFLEHLLDSIEQRVLVIGEDKKVVRANQAALEAYGADVVGRAYEDVGGERTGAEADPVAETFGSGTSHTVERVHGSGSSQTIVHAQLFPVRHQDGDIDAVIEISRDVTNDKRLQAQIIHQERMATLGLLAAGMAHDIGNPLASILAQLRMTREVGGEERMRTSLDVVEKEIQRISRQLRGFVAFSRRRRDVNEHLDVNSVVQDMVTLLVYNPNARGCEIQTQLARNLPPLRADEDLVVQVLVNLCINALDAMAGGGTLTVSTAGREGFTVIRVEDSGPGVPEELRERIFDALTSTKPVGRGTGLGLFMARRIAESLGGELVLVSTSERGTVFEFRLPTAEKEAT